MQKLRASAKPIPIPILDPELAAAVAKAVPPKTDTTAWTIAETAQHMAAMESMMLATLSDRRMETAMRERYGVGRSRTHRLKARIHEQWTREGSEAAPHNRAAAIRRVKGYIMRAQGERNADDTAWKVKPDWPAVRAFESLLADFEGTRAPIEIAVEHRISHTIQAVIANLSPEQTQARLEAARERAQKADAYDRQVGAGVVTAKNQ